MIKNIIDDISNNKEEISAEDYQNLIYKYGKEIDSDFKLGDLAFFGKSPKKITHVGILIDNTKIVHAYGVVRIDKLTSEGIYNNEEKRITHILQKVKRVN